MPAAQFFNRTLPANKPPIGENLAGPASPNAKALCEYDIKGNMQ